MLLNPTEARKPGIGLFKFYLYNSRFGGVPVFLRFLVISEFSQPARK